MKDPFTRKILFWSLAFHLVAALFSTGYHHYDEHYQILEWASAQLGLTPFDRLAWEYEARIRPWLQQGIAFLVSKTAMALGVFNPFLISCFLRLLSAILGWWVTVKLVECCTIWFPDPKVRRIAVMSTAVAWFLPYLHARFSSENWSGIFFLLGMFPLIHLVTNQKTAKSAVRQALVTGLLCGLYWGAAFQFRFQSALLIAPAFLWAARFADRRREILPSISVGFLLLFALGLFLDRWGYGQWTFTAWNYFDVNILQSKANEWGVAPFWFYFYRFFILAPPLSSLLVLGTVACWIFARRFSFTWVSLGFILVHSIIGHKELRFLFPVIPLTPILTAMALQKSQFLNRFFVQRSLRWSAAGLFVMNGLFMIPLVSLPTRTEMKVLRLIWNEQPESLWVSGINPYAVPGVEMFFYRPAEMEMLPVGGHPELVDGHVVCLYPAACADITAKVACEDLGGSLPAWLESRVTPQIRERTRLLDWHLLRCKASH